MENTKGMEKDTVHQTDEIEIDLWEICLVLIHNLALIISVGIMAALVAFLATQLFGVPKYESTTKDLYPEQAGKQCGDLFGYPVGNPVDQGLCGTDPEPVCAGRGGSGDGDGSQL